MKRPEQQLHTAIKQYLTLVLPKGVFWSSLDHAGGGQMVGRFRKARGVKSGLPDVMLISCGIFYGIELKAEGGTLSQGQKDCHAAIRASGAHVAVCRSIDDVAETLAEWSIQTRDGNVTKRAA